MTQITHLKLQLSFMTVTQLEASKHVAYLWQKLERKNHLILHRLHSTKIHSRRLCSRLPTCTTAVDSQFVNEDVYNPHNLISSSVQASTLSSYLIYLLHSFSDGCPLNAKPRNDHGWIQIGRVPFVWWYSCQICSIHRTCASVNSWLGRNLCVCQHAYHSMSEHSKQNERWILLEK